MKPLPLHRWLSVMGRVIGLGVVVLGVLYYQQLWDQYALWTFKPAAPMAAVEGRLELTEAARGILYRAEPQLDQKAIFNSDCDTLPHDLELGCFYHGRIYVLQIDNDSLAPEMDVVTAHELLHAAWARLGSSERQRLGQELERVYAGLRDDDLKQRMASYATTEPGEEANELHSILGTEYGTLSPMLNEYYGRYFKDRGRVVLAHEVYQTVFSSRRTELESELAHIRLLKGQLGAINQQMQLYRNRGMIDQYNSLVPRQNQLVDDINGRIDDYRRGVDEYNALSKSLDSQQITDTESPAQ